VRVTDATTLQRLADAWGGRWDGRWQYRVTEGGFEDDGGAADGKDHGPVRVFAVRLDKVLAFGKGEFSHTRFRTA
jgi:hypothetical protein